MAITDSALQKDYAKTIESSDDEDEEDEDDPSGPITASQFNDIRRARSVTPETQVKPFRLDDTRRRKTSPIANDEEMDENGEERPRLTRKEQELKEIAKMKELDEKRDALERKVSHGKIKGTSSFLEVNPLVVS